MAAPAIAQVPPPDATEISRAGTTTMAFDDATTTKWFVFGNRVPGGPRPKGGMYKVSVTPAAGCELDVQQRLSPDADPLGEARRATASAPAQLTGGGSHSGLFGLSITPAGDSASACVGTTATLELGPNGVIVAPAEIRLLGRCNDRYNGSEARASRELAARKRQVERARRALAVGERRLAKARNQQRPALRSKVARAKKRIAAAKRAREEASVCVSELGDAQR